MKSKRGSIAVLLASILLSVFLAVAALIEAASVTSAASVSEAVSELAGRAVLAQYHRELQSRYGIFAFCHSGEKIEEELSYFANAAVKEGLEKGNGLVRLKYGNVKVDLAEHSLLRPDILELQILSYMKYRAPLSLIGVDTAGAAGGSSAKEEEAAARDMAALRTGRTLEHDGDGVQTGGAGGNAAPVKFADAASPDTPEEEGRLLQDLVSVGIADQLNSLVEPVYQAYGTMLEAKAGIKPLWEKWRRMLEEGGEDEGYEERLRKQELRIMERLEKVKELAQRCQHAITNFESRLHSLGENPAGNNLAAQIEEIKAETESHLQLTPDTLSFHSDEDGLIDHQNELFSTLEKKKEEYEKHLTDAFDEETEIIGEEGERTLLNEKILSGLPSTLHEHKGTLLPDFSGIDDLKDLFTAGRNVLYTNAYIHSMFRHRLTEGEREESFFRNEIEYIIIGKTSDKANRKRVEALLFALRCSSNLAHIYSCSEKRTEVSLLAAALTPGPAAPLTQGILSSIWAAAEAKMDLDRLFEGGRVPLLKDDDSWRLSLDSAINGSGAGQDEKNKGRGLSYEEYLNLFLLLKNREDKLIRTMDLIQINIKGQWDGQFLIKNCHTGFSAVMTVNRQSLFSKHENRFTAKELRQIHIY